MLIQNKTFWPQPSQNFDAFYVTVFRSEACRGHLICAISAARENMAHCITGEGLERDYTWSYGGSKRQAEYKQGAKHPHPPWYSIKHYTTVLNLSDCFPELPVKNSPLSLPQREKKWDRSLRGKSLNQASNQFAACIVHTAVGRKDNCLF